MTSLTFRCSKCGELHEGPSFSYGIEAPDLWAQMPEDRRERRGELDSEICVIDNEHFFIKGNLWIPVLDGDQEFNWTVWVAVGKADFDRSIELWEAPNRELEPAYRCSLANELSLYPGSLVLEAQLITMGVGERPSIQLEPTEHPLAVEQREGLPSSVCKNWRNGCIMRTQCHSERSEEIL